MHKEDKAALIVGVSLVVIGTAGLVIIDRLAQKHAKRASEEYREQRMQQGWEMIQRSRAFTALDSETRIKMFDAYWKTTGGRKPQK